MSDSVNSVIGLTRTSHCHSATIPVTAEIICRSMPEEDHQHQRQQVVTHHISSSSNNSNNQRVNSSPQHNNIVVSSAHHAEAPAQQQQYLQEELIMNGYHQDDYHRLHQQSGSHTVAQEQHNGIAANSNSAVTNHSTATLPSRLSMKRSSYTAGMPQPELHLQEQIQQVIPEHHNGYSFEELNPPRTTQISISRNHVNGNGDVVMTSTATTSSPPSRAALATATMPRSGVNSLNNGGLGNNRKKKSVTIGTFTTVEPHFDANFSSAI